MCERHLAVWLDRPLREITPDAVEQKHREIAEEVGRGERFSGEGVLTLPYARPLALFAGNTNAALG